MEILRLEGIEKKVLRKKILQDISIEAKEQSFTAILGPVGAGKTTLFKIIAGSIKPSKGRVFLRGKDITNLPPQKRRVAMVFQAFSLYPNLTVYENMASPLRAARRPESEIREKVETQAEILRMGSLLDKHPYELSGGEGQKVALARALAIRPHLLLLDEPVSALDEQSRQRVCEELRRVQKKF